MAPNRPASDGADSDVRIRQARAADADAVAAFTSETFAGHGVDDYVPRAFEDWVATDDGSQRTLVADLDGTAVGLLQVLSLSEWEAWLQGMRTDPEYRGRGVGATLTEAAFAWARRRGATVARNLVFSWNGQGLGLSRAAGFEPCAEFRWVHPTPDPDADPRTGSERPDPDAAWACWQRSPARTSLSGLGLAADQSWALATLTRERFREAADAGSLLTVRDDAGTRAVALRNRVVDDPGDGDATRRAEYAAAAWRDPDAARALFAAIARDAASVDADATRVPIPETVEAVSEAAAARVPIADDPEFVLEADLSGADRR